MSLGASKNTCCGYLDVKISSKSRRGLTPWKAWQKQWCEIRRLDCINDGIELKLKSSNQANTLNSVRIPRSSTICRMESRTKLYAFGVFTIGRTQKPLLFLSGSSESDTQKWISTIRQMLCVASYLPVGESNFHVSMIDNAHSRAAGLIGMHGVLGTNTQEIVISDPCTGAPKICWQWYQFHQFHLQASSQPSDDKLIIVMHTSGDFSAGAGQIYLYCEQSCQLLNHLVARGKLMRASPGLKACKRLSQSEGDLCGTSSSPIFIRSQAGSDDSGVRVSVSSDDSVYIRQPKTAFSLVSLGRTPGGSENNDNSLQDLTETEDCTLLRNESDISLSSGIYEEISDHPESDKDKNKTATNHIYEDPLEFILDVNCKLAKHCKPPPLPPRKLDLFLGRGNAYKQRSNTLPAQDLSKITQKFTIESDYVVMSPSKLLEKSKDKARVSYIAESLYMPMSPIINLKNNLESYYISMNATKNK